MTLENLAVVHKVFGEGVISEQNGKYIKVRFPDAEKTFVYPDAFEKFLTPAGEPDEELKSRIASDLAEALAEKQKIADWKREENMRAMTHGIVIPGKEISLTDAEDEESKGSSDGEEI